LQAGIKFISKIRFQNLSAVKFGDLKLIFDWDNKPAPEKIKSIQSNFNDRNNLFLQRAVLLTPAGVVKSLLTNFEN